MKLYDGGRAPNPRRVRVFLAEKGIDVPILPVDMTKYEHRSADYTAINPYQLLPALELDDGTVIAESIAICRYFEELHPEPPLFGTGAKGRAVVEMWSRRVELYLYQAVSAAFRHLHPGMAQSEKPQIAEWGEVNKMRATAEIERLDKQLGEHSFLAGEFSIADISAGIAIDFTKAARLTVPEHCLNIKRWHDELKARPSWTA